MAILNSTILQKSWVENGNDYAMRIPDPLKESYSAHVQALFDPMNRDLFNAFTGLLNGIARTYVDGKTFYNPLRILKAPAEADSFGAVERHICVNWLTARSYDANAEDVWKREQPEFSEYYYSLSEPRQYSFTWNAFDIRRAFTSDGTGFNDLLDRTIGAAISADEYDEMNIMLQLIAEAEAAFADDGGIFKHTLSAAPTTQATAQEFLVAVRSYAYKFRFPSVYYNHISIPTFTDRNVLLITPDALSSVDVLALAAAFNRQDAAIDGAGSDGSDFTARIIVVPEFPLPNMYALLCDETFLHCRDAYYGIDDLYIPPQIATKYWLSHAEYFGINPAAPCVAFVTE